MRTYRRKFSNFLIDREFQIKYMLVTVLLLLAYTFIFAVLLFLPYLLTLSFDYPLDELRYRWLKWRMSRSRSRFAVHQGGRRGQGGDD